MPNQDNTKPKIIPSQAIKAVYYQIKKGHPINDFFIEKHALGLFRPSSHIQHDTNEPKVKYGHMSTAESAAQRMHEKTGKTYNAYKCAYCKAFHIGKPAYHKPRREK